MSTIPKNELFILNLTITLRCTLKCKLCVADVTKYSPQPHFETEELCETIDRLFQIVDFAERFQLSGGEPFIHSGIVDIVKKTLSYQEKFGFLGFFTNGTILPPVELLDLLKSYETPEKFMFYISHYGEHSTKVKEIEALLSAYQLPYSTKIYHGEQQHLDGWVDYGNYQCFNHDQKEMETLFSNCGANQMGGIWATRFGEVHRCTRSASGMSLGKVPRVPEDYIDLFDDSISIMERRENLANLKKKTFVTTCNYCSGDFGTADKLKRYPAGEQL